MNPSQPPSPTLPSPPAPSGDLARLPRWLRDYTGSPGRFDEMLGADGRARAPWGRFLELLAKQPQKDFEERWAEARELIHENGVTYNIHGDPDGYERPWQLDPVPLVLSEQDWGFLTDALAQRATLFEALLADLYGERQLLADGAVPPELIFNNERFLRPCVGLPAWQNSALPFYAADVVRAPNGRWWVVSDRTQAPSGMGYALENRVVLARMIPEVARGGGLVRVAGFFDTLRETLAAAAAPAAGDHPHIVLLTPGPHNESYFEHAFLARYLGITLAEGEDLTVRDDRVFLKTLDGLRQVDVVWRRVDESYIDPLELRSESQLGVSGIIQAMRAGNVALLNPPGSGLAEAPALLAFLPGLAQSMLGEELKIPSVATWWCGQDGPRATALAKLDRLVIKHAFHKGAPVLFGSVTGEPALTALAEDIGEDPGSYVAQEEIPYSTAPTWGDRGLEPRQVVLRVFLIKTAGGYVAMPGGLTRVAGAPGSHPGISMQRGSGSKDTWVLAESATGSHQSALEQRFPVEIRRHDGQFSSRVADNLYWIGRVAERSEFTARLLRGIVARVAGEGGFTALADVAPAWDLLVANQQLEAKPSGSGPAAGGIAPLEKALAEAVFAPGRPGSLRGLNTQLLRLGQTSRDSLSHDTWRVVSQLGERLERGARPRRLADSVHVLDDLVNMHAALSGLAQENFTRTPAWSFLDLGRRLERATYAAELMLELLRSPEGERRATLEALLDISDSSITYRQRYYSEPRILPVLDTLLLDPANPRSLAFQVAGIESHLASLPVEARQPHSTPARALAEAALSTLHRCDLAARDPDQQRERLAATEGMLEAMAHDLNTISGDLTGQYFSLLRPEQMSTESAATRPTRLARPAR